MWPRHLESLCALISPGDYPDIVIPCVLDDFSYIFNFLSVAIVLGIILGICIGLVLISLDK